MASGQGSDRQVLMLLRCVLTPPSSAQYQRRGRAAPPGSLSALSLGGRPARLPRSTASEKGLYVAYALAEFLT
jgi:hypothetical protein